MIRDAALIIVGIGIGILVGALIEGSHWRKLIAERERRAARYGRQ